jgi:hypothetical protein
MMMFPSAHTKYPPQPVFPINHDPPEISPETGYSNQDLAQPRSEFHRPAGPSEVTAEHGIPKTCMRDNDFAPLCIIYAGDPTNRGLQEVSHGWDRSAHNRSELRAEVWKDGKWSLGPSSSSLLWDNSNVKSSLTP